MKPSTQHPAKSQFSEMEERVIELWDKNNTFQRSVDERPADQAYSFYDGPPFATGLPHYGHILASINKDVVPRYHTMRGQRVERVWGWDCHGLPIENIIEKDLNLKTKHDIENFGVAKFNDACKATVFTYAEEWKKTIRRLGRWVDMEHDYKTMDRNFMESVWWVFKQLWDRNLVYEGKKSMHICTRCVTPLSNFEVTLGYKDVKDIAAFVKFQLTDCEVPTYIIAWTTTPWTLPGNVALAIGKDVQYVEVECEGARYIVSSHAVEKLFADKEHSITNRYTADQLAGKAYTPVFDFFAKDSELENHSNGWKIYIGDFVSDVEGTGVVHIAPAFGEDDMNLGKQEKLPFVQHVSMDGKFTQELESLAGIQVKPKGEDQERLQADIAIIKALQENGTLFKKENVTHSYPHCWRCDTPLLNYATSSWFVSVTEMKEDLLANNQKINWHPEHLKDGRFGQWLENARDWAISRNRYWGTPLPVWRADDGELMCVGSVKELEQLSGTHATDLHKQFVDEITFEKNGKTFRRIPEVFDCWFESGSMPYAQMHYPFENKEHFEASFPADFISEAQDQTRGWFYTLHVLATALTRGENPAIPSTGGTTPAFKNVSVFGIVLAADGKKMSKKLKNYPDPTVVLEKYGADVLRLYLAQSPVIDMEPLNFDEKDVEELHRKYTNTLWNVYTFFKTFADNEPATITEITNPDELSDPMDEWIMTNLQLLLKRVTAGYEAYHLRDVALPLLDFVQELSTWYVRRIRTRCKSENAADRMMALRTLYTVLKNFVCIAAPVTPFITEEIYQQLRTQSDADSVHLAHWPEVHEAMINSKVMEDMECVRASIEAALALRAEHKLKVRQPLQSVTITGEELAKELQAVIAEELNVKEVHVGSAYAIDTTLTPELKAEGLLRELVRQTNALRKNQKLTLNDRVNITIATQSEAITQMLSVHTDEYLRQVLGLTLTITEAGAGEAMNCDGEQLTMSLTVHG
ncbi:MAG: isoleucine--tRNA ligase [Candidatus Kerfeldbacteria bacterium]|nr:isoleucine--tRNA ligase [Candidatus Kerfeldbacteria bacterium]